MHLQRLTLSKEPDQIICELKFKILNQKEKILHNYKDKHQIGYPKDDQSIHREEIFRPLGSNSKPIGEEIF